MANVLIEWIRERILNNKNIIIVVVGETGSGKTYHSLAIALRIAERLETNFTIENNVVFDFQNLVNKYKLDENKKPGTPFVFEEVGAAGGGASARQWQSKTNVLFNSMLQTDRHKNRVLIMTVPDYSFIDAASRKLVHLFIEMSAINFKAKQSISKVKFQQINKESGKIYRKYIRYYDAHNRRCKYKRHTENMIPKDILNAYEVKKDNFSEKLLDKITNYFNEAEDKPKAQIKKINESTLINLVNKGMTTTFIASIFECNTRSVREAKARLREKGKIKDIESNKDPMPGYGGGAKDSLPI